MLSSPTPRYIDAFLGVGATQCNIPATFSYQHNNISTYLSRPFVLRLNPLISGNLALVADAHVSDADDVH